jgi:hypothetical protein
LHSAGRQEAPSSPRPSQLGQSRKAVYRIVIVLMLLGRFANRHYGHSENRALLMDNCFYLQLCW